MAVVLLVARGVAVAALLSAFGALAFGLAVLPRTLVKVPAELAAALIRCVRTVASLSLVVVLLALPAWAALQAMALEPPSDLGETLLAVPGLLLAVRFGQFALAGALACGLALLALHWPGCAHVGGWPPALRGWLWCCMRATCTASPWTGWGRWRE